MKKKARTQGRFDVLRWERWGICPLLSLCRDSGYETGNDASTRTLAKLFFDYPMKFNARTKSSAEAQTELLLRGPLNSWFESDRLFTSIPWPEPVRQMWLEHAELVPHEHEFAMAISATKCGTSWAQDVSKKIHHLGSLSWGLTPDEIRNIGKNIENEDHLMSILEDEIKLLCRRDQFMAWLYSVDCMRLMFGDLDVLGYDDALLIAQVWREWSTKYGVMTLSRAQFMAAFRFDRANLGHYGRTRRRFIPQHLIRIEPHAEATQARPE